MRHSHKETAAGNGRPEPLIRASALRGNAGLKGRFCFPPPIERCPPPALAEGTSAFSRALSSRRRDSGPPGTRGKRRFKQDEAREERNHSPAQKAGLRGHRRPAQIYRLYPSRHGKNRAIPKPGKGAAAGPWKAAAPEKRAPDLPPDTGRGGNRCKQQRSPPFAGHRSTAILPR